MQVMQALSTLMLIMHHRIVIVILARTLLLVVQMKPAPSLWGEYVDPMQFGRETEELGDQQQ
jgi:hypothetical protein